MIIVIEISMRGRPEVSKVGTQFTSVKCRLDFVMAKFSDNYFPLFFSFLISHFSPPYNTRHHRCHPLRIDKMDATLSNRRGRCSHISPANCDLDDNNNTTLFDPAVRH